MEGMNNNCANKKRKTAVYFTHKRETKRGNEPVGSPDSLFASEEKQAPLMGYGIGWSPHCFKLAVKRNKLLQVTPEIHKTKNIKVNAMKTGQKTLEQSKDNL